jgi:hypothetical protein
MPARPDRSRFEFAGITDPPGAETALPKMLLPMAFVGVEFEVLGRRGK